jgi:dihydropteroate synthase
VNDVSGLRFDPALADVVARTGAELLLGHSRGTPATMQRSPRYDDVLREVGEELAESVSWAEAAGLPRERLSVDPGIGFGKRLEDNLALLARPDRLRGQLGLPVVVGPSRKSFLGTLTGDPPAERDLASHAACAVAIFAGCDGIRVHDAAGAARAAAVAWALREARLRSEDAAADGGGPPA